MNPRRAEFSRMAPAPRPVSLALRTKLAFGGFSGSFGWLWMSISMVVWLVAGASHAIVLQGLAWTHEHAEVDGVVTDWRDTNTSINEETLVEMDVRYEVAGTPYLTQSYEVESGQLIRSLDRRGAGLPVRVEYLVARPHIAHIVGTSWSAMPFFIVLIIGIFPAIGLAFILSGLVRGLHSARLLRHGKIAFGTLAYSENTGASVNDEPVVRYFFEFTDDSGQRRKVSVDTHEPSSILDEDEEPILYDPKFPDEGVVCDGLPGEPTLTDRGGFATTGGAALYLIAPVLCAGMLFWSFIGLPW